MSPQVRLVSEGAGTFSAGERLLSSVGPEVALQQPGSGEGLAAMFTLAREGVSPYVHFKCAL